MKIAVGMDVHAKRSSAYAVYAGIGEMPERHERFLGSFNREFEDFPSTGKWMEKMAAFVSKHECHVLIESTTKSHEIYWMLQIKFAADAQKRVDMGEKTVLYMSMDDPMYKLINSIPGFGVLSSAYFTSLIVDVDRFPSGSKFAASSGIVPKTRSSAGSNPRCSTTHRGDDLARYLLMFCVLSHVKHVEDSVVTMMYRRLVERANPRGRPWSRPDVN